jgi:hypothetical protein
MTPETAKQTIQAYLDLGTLQGVKVEYDYTERNKMFYQIGDDIFWRGVDGGEVFQADDSTYTSIKSIEPIPMEPKLLEVGDRVKVIETGEKGEITCPVYLVVPESLLVEEEESEAPLCQCSSVLSALIRGEITKEEAAQKVIKHEVELAKELLNAGFKTSIQAGYKVTKE